MDHNNWLNFLEQHEDLVDDDNWDSIYTLFHEKYSAESLLTTYLHELGFDPLPYMKEIPDNMYFDCSWIEDITIPDNVTHIGYHAFAGCSDLTRVVIPDSVTSMGTSTFFRCPKLKEVSIGNSVTSVDDCAFSGCSGLTSVTIGNSVTSIGNSAFWECDGLTSIIIPDSVTRIDDYAFSGCIGLTDITYKGTKVQWSAVEKGDDWDYKAPANVVHCNDGDVRL